MKTVYLFTLTAIEMSSTIILWNALNKGSKVSLVKNIIVMIVITSITTMTDPLNIYIGSFINYASFVFLMKLLFQKNIKDIFLEFCLVALLSLGIECAGIGIIKLMGMLPGSHVSFNQELSITLFTLACAIMIYRRVPIRQLLLILRDNISKFFIFIINILIYIVMIKLLWEQNEAIIMNHSLLFVAFPAMLITINMIYYQIFKKILEEKKIMEAYKKYSPVMTNLLEEARRKQHDYKNHLNTIYGLCQLEEEATVKQAIQEYIASINSSMRPVERLISIDNNILAAILYSKICEAEKNGITIQHHVLSECDDSVINDYEMTEIVSNLLDNACEAVWFASPENKQVFLDVINTEVKFCIEVGNIGETIPPPIAQKLFHRGYSTKDSDAYGSGHGYGLYNIKKIVDHHHGEIKLSHEKGYNCFKVYFNKLSGISGSPNNQKDPV